MVIPILGEIEFLAKIVSEIMSNIKAKGAEAEKQFAQAIARNGVSLKDMVEMAGGTWPEEIRTMPGSRPIGEE
jgi:hypothetical protein